jgi:hypothetical protein
MLVIRITKYSDWLGPSGKFFENSTKLTYLEITGWWIKYRTVLWLLELQIRQGRKVRTQVHAVNSNSRTSDCQCSLFSKKNPIIRIFCISGRLAVPINPDMWSSIVLTICPGHFNPLIWVYVTKAMSLYNLCSSSRYRLSQIPLACNGPSGLRKTILSKEPTICAAFCVSVTVPLPYRTVGLMSAL